MINRMHFLEAYLFNLIAQTVKKICKSLNSLFIYREIFQVNTLQLLGFGKGIENLQHTLG